jgi:hypothetical protein
MAPSEFALNMFARGLLKQRLSGLDVTCDLPFEIVQALELLFFPQPGHERDLELFPVEIPTEIEQVNLDTKSGLRRLQGGAVADVHHRPVSEALAPGMGSVDPIGRTLQSGNAQVGGRKTELRPQVITGHNRCRQRIISPQHPARGLEIAASNRLSHPRAADGFLVQRNGGKPVHDEMQLCSHRLQQLNIPSPLMPELEGISDADAVDVLEIPREAADKILGGQLTEGPVEGDQPGRVGSERGEGAELLRERMDQARSVIRGEDGSRVAVEGDDDGEPFKPAGIIHRAADDLLMAEVDAIEHADGEADFPRSRLEFTGCAEDFHLGEWDEWE